MSHPIPIAVALSNMQPTTWLDPLRAAFERCSVDAHFVLFEGQPIGARYAVVWLPPATLFEQERQLAAVFNVGAGVEGLLALAGLPADVPLVRLVDAGMAPKMAEYVAFYIARVTRGLDRFVQQPDGTPPSHDWDVDRPRGVPPAVGVLGLGAIGTQIGRALRLFGYPVRGWSRTRKQLEGIECFAGHDELVEFLSGTHFLVNVLPLTPATENLLDSQRLGQLPRGAQLINIGRGGTIVDADLISALDSGQLGGAVLDVFRNEPLPSAHPFWAHPKIIVTPHLSGPTPREQAAEQIAAAVLALERGADVRSLQGYVDRARGY